MHTTEAKNESKEAANDGPSVLGRFTWAVVGRTCVPCLLKNDNSRYVSVRIAESEVLGHFLHKLNTEVFNCISVKSFGITEAENKLLNEINSKHCEYAYGKEAFSMNSDFIVKLDDLVEFYNFMDICYNKLLLQNATANDRNNKCGFVRINDDSVVPYAVKNDQKYVPLFYFEGETESLKTKAINLENWDLAYLKFCCKVQGIKNELFASEKCMVTSLEDVKSYFPEGTKFDDYWPSKIVEMQQPSNRGEMNGNHSWVQTPHVDTSTAVPPSQSSVPTNKVMSSALSRQLHNNQRVNSTAVITNLTSNVPIYPNSSWPNTLMGNSSATVSSSTYQLSQQPNQPRGAQKMNSASMHTAMSQNPVMTPRTYVNQSIRSQPPQYYLSHVNVPNASGTPQAPPPLVRVSTANSVSNAYGNTISSDAYSSHIYQNNNQSLPNLLAVPSRHLNNAPSQQQPQIKRGPVSNQVASSTVTRYPPALTPINGTNHVIQAAANSTSLGNLPNNVNNVMSVHNRQQQQPQQQHRTNLIQSGGEIIDLSSPPHSPQHMNNAVNRISSVTNSNYSLKSNSHPNLPPLKRITDTPLMKNGVPQYKVETIKLFNKSIPVINLKPYSDAEYAISLHDIIANYFPRVDVNKLRNWLQNVLGISLYEANVAQVQLLREYSKGKAVSDDLPLLCTRDFESNYPRITYLEDRDKGERDAKRQKVS